MEEAEAPTNELDRFSIISLREKRRSRGTAPRHHLLRLARLTSVCPEHARCEWKTIHPEFSSKMLLSLPILR